MWKVHGESIVRLSWRACVSHVLGLGVQKVLLCLFLPPIKPHPRGCSFPLFLPGLQLYSSLSPPSPESWQMIFVTPKLPSKPNPLPHWFQCFLPDNLYFLFIHATADCAQLLLCYRTVDSPFFFHEPRFCGETLAFKLTRCSQVVHQPSNAHTIPSICIIRS